MAQDEKLTDLVVKLLREKIDEDSEAEMRNALSALYQARRYFDHAYKRLQRKKFALRGYEHRP